MEALRIKIIKELRLYTIFLHNSRPNPSIYCSTTPDCGCLWHTTQCQFFGKICSSLPKVRLQFGNIYCLRNPSKLETPKNWKGVWFGEYAGCGKVSRLRFVTRAVMSLAICVCALSWINTTRSCT